MEPQFIASLITILVVINAILLTVAYLILLERKLSAWIQDRVGPNRVGPGGLLQPMADGLKFLLKEDFTPPNADRKLFTLAPILAVAPALMGWAVIPWGGLMRWGEQELQIAAAPLNIGVIFILAISSLAVYGVVVGGYASNNKYSFLGGLRGTAQMISYEIPMGLSVLIVILMTHSARADDLIHHTQANGVWTLFYQPILAVIFFTCVLAETNRAPFDLPEAESELVGGYHTEYSAMRFALYFLGEYMHMITGAAFFTLLFLGGWDLPFVQEPAVGGLGWVVLKAAVFGAKVLLLLAFMMVLRWTLPRFRFDQLMRLAWRSLIPITLLILLGTGVIVFLRVRPWIGYPLLNLAVLTLVAFVTPRLPVGPPVNRRIPLAGSRFSPLTTR